MPMFHYKQTMFITCSTYICTYTQPTNISLNLTPTKKHTDLYKQTNSLQHFQRPQIANLHFKSNITYGLAVDFFKLWNIIS